MALRELLPSLNAGSPPTGRSLFGLFCSYRVMLDIRLSSCMFLPRVGVQEKAVIKLFSASSELQCLVYPYMVLPQMLWGGQQEERFLAAIVLYGLAFQR